MLYENARRAGGPGWADRLRRPPTERCAVVLLQNRVLARRDDHLDGLGHCFWGSVVRVAVHQRRQIVRAFHLADGAVWVQVLGRS